MKIYAGLALLAILIGATDIARGASGVSIVADGFSAGVFLAFALDKWASD